jgi:hypothetical protein
MGILAPLFGFFADKYCPRKIALLSGLGCGVGF